jgi:phage-related protein
MSAGFHNSLCGGIALGGLGIDLLCDVGDQVNRLLGRIIPQEPRQSGIHIDKSSFEGGTELSKEDRKTIGNDIRTVELGWPIGMPVCRKLEGYSGLREVRSEISDGCIARIIFYINGNEMILLHGFIKKTQKTPKNEIDLAVKRKKEHEKHE